MLADLAYRFHIELSSNKARSSDRKPPGKHFFQGEKIKWSNEAILRFYEKIPSNIPRHVVWAEESKNSLRFEIRPSYDGVPMASICLTDGQSSCMLFIQPVSLVWLRLKISFV